MGSTPEVQNYGRVESVGELQRLVDQMLGMDSLYGFDLETGYEGQDREKGSLSPHTGSFVVGLSLAPDTRTARYVPLRHDFGPNLDTDEVYGVVRPLLASGRAVCHHGKFERRMLRTDGEDCKVGADTLLAAYVLQEWPPGTLNLKDLVEHPDLCGHKMAHIEDLFPDINSKYIRFNPLDPTDPKVVAYACEDAAWCLALRDILVPRAEKYRPFMYKLEMRISDLVVEMEDWGVAADWDAITRCQEQTEGFSYRMATEVKAELGALVGRDLITLNLGSPKQLAKLLFEERGYKPEGYTEKGAPSTDAVAMTRLAKKHPEVRLILRLREVEHLLKRCNLWLDSKPKKPHTRGLDGRAHASYSQTAVGPGRFSASDPAIQQLPKAPAADPNVPKSTWWELKDGTQFKVNFRDFIVAAPGTYLLSFDFSQIELRVLAGESQEPALLEAFEKGVDVHAQTAALILGKPHDRVSKDDRDIGKRMNFALLYQMSPGGLAQRLGIPKDRGEELYRQYFSSYPRVRAWTESAKRSGKELMYSETHFKRRYTVWELRSGDKGQVAKGERVLVNAPIQGGAADYTKLAMLRAQKALTKAGWWGSKVRMVMNQHDALSFEVEVELDPREVIRVLRPAVEFPVEGWPQNISEWEFGQQWGSSVPVDEEADLVLKDGVWALRGADPVPESGKDEDPFLLEEGEEDADLQEPVLAKVPTEDLTDLEQSARVIITCPALSEAQFERLLALIKDLPGDRLPVVRTPEGELVLERFRTGLGPAEGSRVGVAVPGAQVTLEEDAVNPEGMLSGLPL